MSCVEVAFKTASVPSSLQLNYLLLPSERQARMQPVATRAPHRYKALASSLASSMPAAQQREIEKAMAARAKKLLPVYTQAPRPRPAHLALSARPPTALVQCVHSRAVAQHASNKAWSAHLAGVGIAVEARDSFESLPLSCCCNRLHMTGRCALCGSARQAGSHDRNQSHSRGIWPSPASLPSAPALPVPPRLAVLLPLPLPWLATYSIQRWIPRPWCYCAHTRADPNASPWQVVPWRKSRAWFHARLLRLLAEHTACRHLQVPSQPSMIVASSLLPC